MLMVESYFMSAAWGHPDIRSGKIELPRHADKSRDQGAYDIRGSTVTRLAELECTELEIAAITGHTSSDVRSILDSAYLTDENAR
jgi:hypothetical protein